MDSLPVGDADIDRTYECLNMSDTLIKVEGVSKKFCRDLKRSLWYGMQDLGNELLGRRHGGNGALRNDEFWAVNDVSFELKRGECLGLIGHNGAGKTTLLRMLNGLIKPDKGRIEMRGRVGALIALGAGFNPILTGRENIYVNASILGLSKREIETKIDEIIDFAEIGEFIDSPVQNYSSGMTVRLGFAVATAITPDILLLDEVLAVGDTMFRAKCLQRIGKILSNTSVIFVSHDQNQVSRICDKVLLLEKGKVVYQGSTCDGLSFYRNINLTVMESYVFCVPSITSPLFSASVSRIIWGDNLEFILKFNANIEFDIGLFLIHLSNDNMFVSHAEVKFESVAVCSGKNIYKIVVQNNQLVAGRFYASISVFSKDRKTILLHMINATSFEVIGSRGYGPSILQKARIETVLSKK